MKTFRIAPEIILYDYAEEKTMPKFFFVAQTSSIMKDSSA